MLRSSVDADGADVLHLGLQVEGVVFELVGAAGDMPGVERRRGARARSAAAHALPFTLAYLSDLVGLADDADDDFALYANEPLLAVALGVAQRTSRRGARYEHAAVLTGASHNVTHDSATCVVVDMGWDSQPGVAIRFVDNLAAQESRPRGLRRLRAPRPRGLPLRGRRAEPGRLDRYLDQHLGIWYSGRGELPGQRSALRVLLADVPYAERQQPDAHLFYAGYDGPLLWNTNFAAFGDEVFVDASENRRKGRVAPPPTAQEWAALVNKVAYFGAMGVDWALWIGDLDDRLSVEETPTCAARADNVPGLRKHWVSESKGSVYDGDASRAVSNHLIKILAVYAMSDRPGVTGVAYVDLDAMAHRKTS
ncbi:tRNA (adenine-N6-)-methyltransferase [Aureococcus anophagefferens]|nr:tRNA (adenine-N6-)-methyltransferase [Aureococcus anophagefferens]